MGTLAGCVVTTLGLFGYYVWENRRRGHSKADESEDAYMSPEAWANMTDQENRRFRYTY